MGGGGGRARGMLLEAVRDGERVEWSNKREILEFPQSTERKWEIPGISTRNLGVIVQMVVEICGGNLTLSSGKYVLIPRDVPARH